MYRIDEDTYIDDSLVTCAEYQLFIDEMLAQGKFYQPDHWTSYQFPKGQAHASILGVRPSDAQAFCKWLSQQPEVGEWAYRLATPYEAVNYPVTKKNEKLCGYWVLDRKVNSFTWIGYAPTDIRDIRHHLEHDLKRARTQYYDIDYVLASDLDLTRSITRALIVAIDRDCNLNRVINLDHIIEHAIGYDPKLAHDLARTIDRDLIRTIDRADAIDRARIRVIDLALDLDRGRDVDRDLDPFFCTMLSFWVGLVGLQERIAGYYPDFEGIRIVKAHKSNQVVLPQEA